MILQDELKAKDVRHERMKTLQNHLSIEAIYGVVMAIPTYLNPKFAIY